MLCLLIELFLSSTLLRLFYLLNDISETYADSRNKILKNVFFSFSYLDFNFIKVCSILKFSLHEVPNLPVMSDGTKFRFLMSDIAFDAII